MNKKYRELNKEEKKAYHRAYYEANKDRLKKESNEHYHANRDREIIRRREYYKNHRDTSLKKQKEYYHKHKERNKERRKEYARTHKRQSKNYKLLLYYGINIEQYEEMYYKQDGKCAICKVYNESLVVDHDHKTSKIRGLLCKKCNLSLGYVNDNTKILKSMIAYIKRNK